MKLFSCYNCGVVLDPKVLAWPTKHFDYSRQPRYSGDLSPCGRLVAVGPEGDLRWKPTLPCPVCQNPLTEPGAND
jgi:hypothetical protein